MKIILYRKLLELYLSEPLRDTGMALRYGNVARLFSLISFVTGMFLLLFAPATWSSLGAMPLEMKAFIGWLLLMMCGFSLALYYFLTRSVFTESNGIQANLLDLDRFKTIIACQTLNLGLDLLAWVIALVLGVFVAWFKAMQPSIAPLILLGIVMLINLLFIADAGRNAKLRAYLVMSFIILTMIMITSRMDPVSPELSGLASVVLAFCFTVTRKAEWLMDECSSNARPVFIKSFQDKNEILWRAHFAELERVKLNIVTTRPTWGRMREEKSSGDAMNAAPVSSKRRL